MVREHFVAWVQSFAMQSPYARLDYGFGYPRLEMNRNNLKRLNNHTDTSGLNCKS